MTVLKLGMRELRGGLKGFRIFIACLALGVMVIAAVGALADALRAGLASQGETILGGDMTFSRMHVRATPKEQALFRSLGRVSETSTMRTMARRLDGSDQALAELKSVDAAYPLSGETTIESGKSFADAVSGNGAVVDPMLLERLGLKVGDRFRIGEAEIQVRGILKAEPDAVADRLTYGPRIFVSLATLDKTALVKPGRLFVGATPSSCLRMLRQIAKRWRISARRSRRKCRRRASPSVDRYDPSPQITRTLERLRQFLILIGLASLLVGGVGIANAVGTFIDKRIKVVATMRSVGASGAQIIGIFLVQILLMSAIGIAIGLALGIAVPPIIENLYGDLLPIHAGVQISPGSLGIAALYGFLVALVFALWPLGRVENVRAAVLFRDFGRLRRRSPAQCHHRRDGRFGSAAICDRCSDVGAA